MAHRGARSTAPTSATGCRRAADAAGRSGSSTSTRSPPASGSRRSGRCRCAGTAAATPGPPTCWVDSRAARGPRVHGRGGFVDRARLPRRAATHAGAPAAARRRRLGHPLVAAAFDDDLRRAPAGRGRPRRRLVEELAALPRASLPRRRLSQQPARRRRRRRVRADRLRLLGAVPIGFDLGQLLVGDVQVGRRSVHDLPRSTTPSSPATSRGCAPRAATIAADVVRRATRCS